MNKNKKSEVVALPVYELDIPAFFVSNTNPKLLQIANNIYDIPDWQGMHLYFLDDIPIKKGETCWAMNKNRDTIYKFEDAPLDNYLFWDRIIATTNKTLTIENVKKTLPIISNDFIEQYCENGGIKEVMLETEFIPTNEDLSQRSAKLSGYYGLKIFSDNSIITYPVLEKTYTKEEFKKGLAAAFLEGIKKGVNQLEKIEYTIWLKENYEI